jgi:WD40 repeat protein
MLAGHTAAISACGAYRDERTGRLVIVTGSWDKTLRLWNGETGIFLKQYQLQSYIYSISILKKPTSQRYFVAVNQKSCVKILDLDTGRLLKSL